MGFEAELPPNEGSVDIQNVPQTIKLSQVKDMNIEIEERTADNEEAKNSIELPALHLRKEVTSLPRENKEK